MKAVMNVHWDIAEHWHHCRLPVSAVFATDDAYAAFYTSKYLIQDTAEAIFAHLDRGFSKDPMAAYLEFLGCHAGDLHPTGRDLRAIRIRLRQEGGDSWTQCVGDASRPAKSLRGSSGE